MGLEFKNLSKPLQIYVDLNVYAHFLRFLTTNLYTKPCPDIGFLFQFYYD